MRQFLTIVVPLLLPSILYLLYATARQSAQAPGRRGWWQEVPWTWHGIAGVLLLLVTLAAIALFGGADPGSDYSPARLIDGEIQPGGFSD